MVVEDVDLSGHLQGIMPKGRRAEFVLEETGDVITAKVQASVAESILTAEMMGKPMTVTARARRRRRQQTDLHHPGLGSGGVADVTGLPAQRLLTASLRFSSGTKLAGLVDRPLELLRIMQPFPAARRRHGYLDPFFE